MAAGKRRYTICCTDDMEALDFYQVKISSLYISLSSVTLLVIEREYYGIRTCKSRFRKGDSQYEDDY